jgi:hypothetical protein
MHSLLKGRAQVGTSGLRRERQQPDSTDRRSGLSMAEPVRGEQADATRQ